MSAIRCLVRPLAAPNAVRKPAPRCAFSLSYTQFSPARRSFVTTTIRYSAKGNKKGTSKVWASADEAVADVQSGSVILSSGFGLCGVSGWSQCAHIHSAGLTSLFP